MDPYEILGLNNTASFEDIKKTYRRLSMKYHPDKNNGVDINNKFSQINRAYEMLSTTNNNLQIVPINNNTKCIVDEKIKKEINYTLFYNLTITFEQSYNGCTLPIDVDIIDYSNNNVSNNTVYVDIFKGIDDGEIIIIKNRGHHFKNNNYGDIRVTIYINKSDKFQRRGMDLITNHTVTLKESLCGFEYNLTHLNNKVYKIKSNNITYPDKHITLSKLGIQRNNYIGNLIIIINVIYPQKLNDDVIEQLKNIL